MLSVFESEVISDPKRPYKMVELTDIAGSPNALAVEADTYALLNKHVKSQTHIVGEVPIISVITPEIDLRFHPTGTEP